MKAIIAKLKIGPFYLEEKFTLCENKNPLIVHVNSNSPLEILYSPWSENLYPPISQINFKGEKEYLETSNIVYVNSDELDHRNKLIRTVFKGFIHFRFEQTDLLYETEDEICYEYTLVGISNL